MKIKRAFWNVSLAMALATALAPITSAEITLVEMRVEGMT